MQPSLFDGAEQLYTVSMRLLEMTETWIFLKCNCFKSISSSPHWNIGRSSIRPTGNYIFLRPTLNWMWWVKIPLSGTVSLFTYNEQKQLEFLLSSQKMLIQENKLVWQELIACERPVGKFLWAAGKPLLLHRDPKREMGPWTGTCCCCCICLAIAPSSYPLERAFFTSFWPANSVRRARGHQRPKLSSGTSIHHKPSMYFIFA